MPKLIFKGGFHNSPKKTIVVKNEKAFEDYREGRVSLSDILTSYQKKVLYEHFCGIKGCDCGSFRRAEVELA